MVRKLLKILKKKLKLGTKLRGRCFPFEYYEGEILTESEARRRRRALIVYSFAIGSIWIHLLGSTYTVSDQNLTQTKTEIHQLSKSRSSLESINQTRGGAYFTDFDLLLAVAKGLGKIVVIVIGAKLALELIDLAPQDRGRDGVEGLQPIVPPHHRLGGQDLSNKQFQKRFGFGQYSESKDQCSESQDQCIESQELEGDFSELTKEQKRNVPSPQDRLVKVDGHEEVVIRHGQAKWKVAKHGNLFDLDSKLNSKNQSVTARTPENIEGYKDRMENLLQKPTNIWMEDGKFQEGTPLEVNSVNIYDPDTRVVLIFKKETREFITSCGLDDPESQTLLETKNFGGPKNSKLWWPKGNNIPTTSPNDITIIENLNIENFNKNEL